MRALVTRPEPGASETARALGARGIEAMVEPLLAVRWLAPELPDTASVDAIALTSGYALAGLTVLPGADGLKSHPVFAVGDQTARAARDAGFADVRSAAGGLAALVETISASLVHGTLLYPRGHHVAGDLGAALAADGIGVVELEVYDMQPAEALSDAARAAIATGSITHVLAYSRRTAETFARLADGLPAAALGRLVALCLSGQVAEPLRGLGLAGIHIAASPNEAAMLEMASSFARPKKPS